MHNKKSAHKIQPSKAVEFGAEIADKQKLQFNCFPRTKCNQKTCILSYAHEFKGQEIVKTS